MKEGTSVRLLVNEERGHGDVIEKLLKQAECLECLVAFAKVSAMDELLKPLRKALERGMDARFAIGLDFYLTEPAVLRKLLKLTEKHKLKLYLSDSSDTFHPKVYAFRHAKGCSVIVGSANFTQGGLYGNYEASAVIEDEKGTLMASVARHFDALIADEVLVPATKARIDAYEREYVIHDICQKVAKKRAQEASRAERPSFTTMAGILELMKNDDSELGFSAQRATRKSNLRQAKRMLEHWATVRGNTSRGFLARFESLIGLFHSGGLHRGKNQIAEHPDKFVAAVADIVGRRNLPPSEAFTVLHEHFEGIPRAGINLLTEILHALDNKRYAVMNQNAVSGLALAGIREYPARPSKQNVGADDYARYCQHADVVRQELGLADFTEVDALFNYAYWGESTGDEAEN
ncbi:TPA: phospholipase D family protein [Pseudomonas aeruginosa]|nr:phospholipase D family protein [Pseudomonas aeruginosa]